jgi:hypothetical protein
LRSLAELLGVERVGVAVDHEVVGRRVFVDGSRPLGDLDCLLEGPVGVRSVPRVEIDPALERMIVVGALAAVDRTVGVGELWRDLRTALRWCARAERPLVVVMADAEPVAVSGMFEPGSGSKPLARVRIGEVLMEVAFGRFVWVMVATDASQAPPALRRLEADTDLGALTFGVAQYPIDGDAAEPLVALALERLAEATRLAP